MPPADNDSLAGFLRQRAAIARARGSSREAQILERSAKSLECFPVVVGDLRSARQVPGVGATALRHLRDLSAEFAASEEVTRSAAPPTACSGASNTFQQPQKALHDALQPCTRSSSSTSDTVHGKNSYSDAQRAEHSAKKHTQSVDLNTPSAATDKSLRRYCPRVGTAAAALLLGLWDLDGGPATKSEIVNAAQRYTMVPLVRLHRGWRNYHRREAEDHASTAPFTWYDGWSSMNSALIRRGLVVVSQSTRPRSYMLTETGATVATSLIQRRPAVDDDTQTSVDDPATSRVDGAGAVPPLVTLRGTAEQRVPGRDPLRAATGVRERVPAQYPACGTGHAHCPAEVPSRLRVHLVLDSREKPEFQALLRQLGIVFWVRSLPAGDALWVASKDASMEQTTTATPGTTPPEQAHVCQVLVERKPLPDLVASIRDQRYRLQKARMRTSGFRRLVYLIEGTARAESAGATAEHERLWRTIEKAALHTKVRDGFHIVRVPNAVVTAHWYQQMTRHLQQRLDAGDASVLVRASACPDAPVAPLTLDQWRYTMQQREQVVSLQAMLCRQLQALPGIRERIAQEVLRCTGATCAHELYDWFKLHARHQDGPAKLVQASRSDGNRGSRPVPATVAALLWQLFT
ncbi:hypothetical protein, conserved [Cyanidioschyzon merolae strain 10D]|uniref:Crossover junction endonuclease MUS81 n=1 Tax=Cyanidioschyzon merolae (strain NIES-3377 / 10D) TaxID=280699 RepID=M1VGT4_CYAM1|nr:hypothetical protein, conserved [Cyanidioschyzon merolae strain 10D]BAM79948.1 hypothetical protein, conserved [Cyanidioschyzon merolae strain 10D]|eukprot:XP_005536234.1 hypothetical protein, conserved [Cyanidioschyzon merolae strain 10D]